MVSRARGIPFVVVCAIVAGLLAIPTAAQAETEKPAWQAGNYWVYRGNFVIPPFGNVDAKMRLDVLGAESITIGTTPYDTFHARLATNMTLQSGQSFNITGNSWFRTSDLAPLKTNMSVTMSGQTVTVTLTASSPQAMHWPLKAGASWSVSSTATLVVEIAGYVSPPQTQTVTGTIQVGALENVTVAAGKFETTPVTLTMLDGGRTKSYWSANAGNSVRDESYNSSGAKTDTSELTSYSYTKPSAASGGFSGLGTFLGLDWAIWIAVLVVGTGVAAGAIGARRRRRMESPPDAMPSMPTTPESSMEPGPPSEPPTPPP